MPISFKRPTLYSFSPQTKEYCGETKPDIDMAALARDELVFLQPAFTTEVVPPVVPRGSVALWNGTAWDITADYRGQVWWSGEVPVTITDFSDPAAAGLTADPVRPEPPPRDELADRRSAIMAALQEVTAIGSSFVALKKPVPADITDRHDAIVAELQALDKGK